MRKYRFAIIFWLIIAAGAACVSLYSEYNQPTPTVNISAQSELLFDTGTLVSNITNASKNTASSLTIKYYSANHELASKELGTLAGGQSVSYQFKIPEAYVSIKSSIATQIIHSYDNHSYSLVTINDWVNYAAQNISCPLSSLSVAAGTQVFIEHSEHLDAKLLMPPRISVQLTDTNNLGSRFYIKNYLNRSNTEQDALLVLNPKNNSSLADTKYCAVKINTQGIASHKVYKLISPANFFTLAIVGLLIAVLVYRASCRLDKLNYLMIALIRWSFTIFIVNLIFAFYTSLPQVSNVLLWYMQGFKAGLASETLKLLQVTPNLQIYDRLMEAIGFFRFAGGNYDKFNEYCFTPLFFYVLSLNFFLLLITRPNPQTDKYWHLFLRLASIFPGMKKFTCSASPTFEQINPQLLKVALLALAVKIFYLPVFLSWTVSNYFHLTNTWPHLENKFFAVNQFLVDTLIFIDVLIFTIGYLIELPKVKNTIKSVEPTLLGWLVCIVCYPPLNTWVFRPIDIPLTDSWYGISPEASIIVKVWITLLWIVYVWATIALGFKASNLTNRGIISHGPYRYIRHPAYISKLLIWTLSGVFLASMHFFLVLSFWLIYWLRAMTEERHLSQDPDYISYKQKVRWRFLPGVY